MLPVWCCMIACENYANIYHVIVHVIALVRVALGLPCSRLLRPAWSCGCKSDDFSAVEYKSFHDIMVEEVNSFSENGSCSVQIESYHGTVLWESQTLSTLTDAVTTYPMLVVFVFLLCSFHKPGIERGLSNTLVMEITLWHKIPDASIINSHPEWRYYVIITYCALTIWGS
jgi:hypothetical protein